MAEKLVQLELFPIERQWLVLSLRNQRSVLIRSLNKEIPGSEIHALRNREVQAVDALIAKVA